jgi:DNA repair exonuclease SbcCD ATPase subunit
VQSYQSLPDLTGYRRKAAKRIFKLAEEHAEKTTELGRLGSEVEEAKQALQDARSKDTEARALAARKGDKVPGRVHEEKARAHLEDLQDRYGVLERVVADVEADLSRTITESKIELIEEARRKRDEHNERYTEAKRRMRVEHDLQRRHAGIVRWAYSGPAHFSPASPSFEVLSVPDTLPADDPEQAEGEGTVRLVG